MIDFLTLEDVVQIHELQIARFGGAAGLRDLSLLESAIMQLQSSFGGEYLHQSIFEMAAAYLFHLTQNHPFIDGNKRVGLAAMLVFLELNGISIEHSTDELYDLTMKVASSELDKNMVTEKIKELVLGSE